jgi:hypothetical protein
VSCGRVPCAEALGPRVFMKTHPKGATAGGLFYMSASLSTQPPPPPTPTPPYKVDTSRPSLRTNRISYVRIAQHAAPPLAATGLRCTPPRAAGGDGTALGPEVPRLRRLPRACSDPVAGSLRFPPAARAALSPRPAAAFCAASPAATIAVAGEGSPGRVRCARCARCSVRPATTTFSSPGRLCAGHMWRCREPVGP